MFAPIRVRLAALERTVEALIARVFRLEAKIARLEQELRALRGTGR